MNNCNPSQSGNRVIERLRICATLPNGIFVKTRNAMFVLIVICLISFTSACEQKTAPPQPKSRRTGANNRKDLGDLFLIQKSGRFGYITCDGELAFEVPDGLHPLGLDNDHEWFVTHYNETRNYGKFVGGLALYTDGENLLCIDKTGKVVLKHDILPEISNFSEGLIPIHGPYSSSPPTYGYMDITGKMVIPFQFVQASNFSEGFADVVMWSAGRLMWGYVEKTGKVVISPEFEVARKFSEDLAAVQIGKQYGFIDKKGKVVIPPRFERAREFSEGFAVVRFGRGENYKSGFIDKSGNLLNNTFFDEARNFSEGLAAVRFEKKWGYIDQTGAVIIQPQFDEAYSFFEGRAIFGVRTKGISRIIIGDTIRFGYLDRSGKVVIAPDFLSASGFYNGLAEVVTTEPDRSNKPDGMKTGYIDRDGTLVWDSTKW